MLADDGRAVELHHDEAVPSDAGEPETPFGIGGDLRGRCDRDPREVLLLELIARPFLALAASSQGPRSSPAAARISSTWRVAPGTGFPSRSRILAGDRLVLDELERQVVTPASGGNLHPGDPVVCRRGRDDGPLIERYFSFSSVKLGPRSAGTGSGRPVRSSHTRATGTAEPRIADCRRAVELRTRRRAARPVRAPGREPSLCRVDRANPARAARAAVSAFRCRRIRCSRPTSSQAPLRSETRAADAPHAIRPAARRVADANVSFWNSMILSTSRVSSLAAAETDPGGQRGIHGGIAARTVASLQAGGTAARASRRNTAPSAAPSGASPRRASRALSRSRPSASRRLERPLAPLQLRRRPGPGDALEVAEDDRQAVLLRQPGDLLVQRRQQVVRGRRPGRRRVAQPSVPPPFRARAAGPRRRWPGSPRGGPPGRASPPGRLVPGSCPPSGPG